MASSVAAAASTFLGTRLADPAPQSGRIVARFGFGGGKKAAAKKAARPSAPTTDRPLWFPGAVAPDYLDGSLVGDYGFDPFGLGKPAEYLQFELDSLDQNLAKNNAGEIIGTRFETGEVKSTPFQPYTEVFGLQRFRECELIHGRWAMLATLGALSVEWLTGVTWQDAGKVHDTPPYITTSIFFKKQILKNDLLYQIIRKSKVSNPGRLARGDSRKTSGRFSLPLFQIASGLKHLAFSLSK